ncbi:glycosyltransferase [Altibacter sp.]|uniref:glycosyltransferase family protein n=1 Tax=Altibacter sp. TaxID=2024823 RepID=UPI000C8EC1F5|nr:glycosyltransferase [Altibacter sp.]MAP54592.1 glycosyl transferase family 1 [Altibacter sp.]
MKILLVGEYSRLHNSLKEGLLALGHEVTLISTGDHFKGYPSDILLKRPFNTGLLRKMKIGIYRIFGTDITSLSVKYQFFKNKERLKGFDVVQLINESPFDAMPRHEIVMIRFLKAHNNSLFLLSCGNDYLQVQYLLKNTNKYSILKEYLSNEVPAQVYEYVLKYVTPSFQQLHECVFKHIEGVIASDLDYHIPLKDHPNYLGLIPNPINTDTITPIEPEIHEKIIIFLGINRKNYHTKGIKYFEEAIAILEQNYGDEIQISIAENLPYNVYINTYNKAHIVFDQVLSMDQGYNALEAMAKGKVVFTGAEDEFLTKYNLQEDEVCINALPDAEAIVSKVIYLLNNKNKIKEIGNNARLFIEREHDYKTISKRFVAIWKNEVTPKG